MNQEAEPAEGFLSQSDADRFRPITRRDKPKSTDMVGGVLNRVYLTGFMRSPMMDRKTGCIRFHVQINNNESEAIPVELKKGKRIPRGFGDRRFIKVFAHIYGQPLENGRSGLLRVLKQEQPTLLDVSSELTWMAHRQRTMNEAFKPFKDGSELKKASNLVQIGGIVSSSIPVFRKNKRPFLQLTVQQIENEDAAIPVRVTSRVEQLAQAVQVGTPVYIEAGRVALDEHGGIVVLTQLVKQGTPELMPFIGSWADDMVRQAILLRQGKVNKKKEHKKTPETAPSNQKPAVDENNETQPESGEASAVASLNEM